MRVLLFLLFLFVSGCEGVDEDVIGKPSISFTANFACYDTVLSPDDKTLYTLKEGILSHWQISPMKRLDYFDTGDKPKRDLRTYLIYITSDAKRMVIWSKENIELWSLKDHKLIKKIKHHSIAGDITQRGFVTTDKDRLVEWDTKTLSKTKEVKIKKFDNINPKILITTPYSIVTAYSSLTTIRDIDSLKLIDSFYTFGVFDITISNDYRYINLYGEYIDTKSAKIIKAENENSFIKSIKFQKIRKISSSKSYLIASISLNILLGDDFSGFRNKYRFIDKKSGKQIALFGYRNSGEWAIKGHTASGMCFDASPNARKYIEMFIEGKDKRFPINDATFNKYHKKINLKDGTCTPIKN